MQAQSPSGKINRIHTLLAVQSIVVILVSVNRLTDLTTAYVLPNEFLRWVDFNNMLILPLISVVASYLLKKTIEQVGAQPRWHLTFNLVFIIGIYLLAASYGDHEVTNYLHVRFCPNDTTSDLCRIIIFNDDEFSHWLFFAGFVMVNAALLLIQVIFPIERSLSRRDKLLLMFNGLFIAAGIFANLAFEVIGLDLYVVALLALLSVFLWWRHGAQPLVIYYTTAYCLGLALTAIYTLLPA
jgi:hypothetical protein